MKRTTCCVQSHAAQFKNIAKLVEKGKLKSIVEPVLQLAEAKRAHVLSQCGHARRKIVLQIHPTL